MKIFYTCFILLILTACSVSINGYRNSSCLVDPADGKCKKVKSWHFSNYGKNKTDCMRIKYNCQKGTYIFSDWKGCGCARPQF